MGRDEASGTRAYDDAVFEARATRGAVATTRPDTSTLPDVGDVVGGHYRLVRRIGAGTFGKVYLAERVDVPAHRVALKVVAREVFRGRDVARELVMLAAASHPHVVALKDHGATDRYVWLTMPVYEGETLTDRLERGTLDLAEAHAVFAPVARALAALHEAGLRHQDVKPDNVFLARFGGELHPVVLDLGVAAARDGGFVAGTLLFAAPEQVQALDGERTFALSEKLDTYGFATTLLAALVPPALLPGEDATTRGDLRAAHAVRAARPLAKGALPEAEGAPRAAIEAALRSWLAIDPGKRPAMSEVAAEIDVLLAPARERARRAAAESVKRRRVGRAVMGALAAAVVALGLYAYGHRETLRLARELERARAEGAASFDRLDTCVAAHRVAEGELATCGAARARDREENAARLAELAREAGNEERARALAATYAGKLRACEDDGERLQKAYGRDRARLAGEVEAERAERSRAEAAAEDARRAVEQAKRAEADARRGADADRTLAAERALDKAKGELASCAADRAAVDAAAAALAKVARPSPAAPRGPTASRAAPEGRPSAPEPVAPAEPPAPPAPAP
jgi:hypothetical protein